MAQALERNVGEVIYLGPVSFRWLFAAGDRINLLLNKLLGKRYHYSCSIVVSSLYRVVFARKLKRLALDVLFAPAGYTEVAYLRTKTPIIIGCDSTLYQLIGYYSGLSRLLAISEKEVTYIEKKAMQKAALICPTSQWAASSIVQDYGINKARVKVIPFGANIDGIPSREVVYAKKKGSVCRLLFLGVDWDRKGGKVALDAFREMNRLGIPTELTICGCTPSEDIKFEKVTVIPFLDKNNPEDERRLKELFLTSDFLTLPSRAECFGIVFCEASAFGLPSFTTDTGGIADAVVKGENGFRLPLSATGKDFAHAIHKIFTDEEAYYALRKKSRELYEQQLNWDAWANTLNNELVARIPMSPKHLA
jgi:glycosyltransferase involved in cell wall biosynthesis